MLKLYGKYCKGLYGFAILCVVCIALSTLAELFIPKLMSDIVDDAIMPGLFDVAIQISIYMFIFAILSVAFSVASSYLSAKVTLSFGRNVRQSIYTKVCDFAIEDFNSIGTSSLITRTTNDVTQLERFLSMVFGVFVKAPCMLIISVILCFTTSPKISLVVLLAIPFICIGVFIVIKFCVPLMRSLQSKIDAINLVSRENLTGVRVIRAFCKQAFETHRFDLANKDLTDTTVKVTRIIVSIIPLITLILNIVMIAVVWNGAGLISAGELEVGQMMAIIQYSAMLLISVILLSMIFMLWPRAMAACLRINEILEKEVSVKDNDASDDSHIKITGQCVQGVPVVQFKNVNFTYPTAKHNSLSNINLDFELGKSYAVIGGTGSSKSTLLNVIMRFYDVTSGEVLVNGENVSKITQQDLRKQLSFTPQKTILTNGSIKDNITFALDEQDAIDEDRFNKVLHCSCVDEFLTNFEEGANKEISQSETGLSGGQRQRVAIARCIYKDASVYIFDDSFSALDYKTQSMVKTRLDEFLSDKCAIYSTERASIAMLCDEIIMLNKGRILALGNHKDLYDSCPEYKDFVLSQVDESEAV